MNPLSHWKIGLYLAAIFLAGTVAGAFVGFKIGRHMMFAPPRPEAMAARFCDELQSKLNLTPAQAQKIRLIVNDSMTEFGALLSTQVAAAFSNTNARVAAELTPEQKVKFEEIQKEHEKFMHNRFKDTPVNSKKNQ